MANTNNSCDINETVARHDVFISNVREDIQDMRGDVKELNKTIQLFIKESTESKNKEILELKLELERMKPIIDKLNSCLTWCVRGLIGGGIGSIVGGAGYLIVRFVIK